MNEPIVYKTRHCAILSMHFEIQKSGETDVHAGNVSGSVGRAVGRSIGRGIAEEWSGRVDNPSEVLANNSVALADAYNALIEEGWIPQSTGFGGSGSGRTRPQHEYIFVQIFTKPKEEVKKKKKENGL